MKTRNGIGLVLLVLFVALGQWAANGETEIFESKGRASRPDVAPVRNEQYAQECGACHFAYQPGLLPAASWEKIMGNLSDHFGDNAALAPEDQAALRAYLVSNAADRVSDKRSERIVRSLKGKQVPIRITELPYIVRQHDEIPKRLLQENKDVRSLSNCAACHTLAEKGIYDEETVKIPGGGQWDD